MSRWQRIKGRLREFAKTLRDPAGLRYEQLDTRRLVEPRIDLWVASPERDWYLKRLRPAHRWLVGVGVIALAAWVLASPWLRGPHTLWWAALLGGAAVVAAGFCAVPYLAARGAYRDRRRQTAALRADYALFRLEPRPGAPRVGSPAESLPLAALFTLNRRQLDAYQELTQRQQRSAFRLTQVASIAGLLVLIGGIVIALSEASDVNKYVVGGLTGLGALLSAYLTSTFFDAHRAADQRLDHYYREPYALGKLLIAERISSVMGDTESNPAHATTMIGELLKWELPAFSSGAAANGKGPA